MQRLTQSGCRDFGRASQKLSTAFAKISTQLGADGFIDGDTMGMVDIAWLPLLHRAAIVAEKSGYNFLLDLPRAKRWQAAIMATDIPAKSIPEDFVERFSAFYLPEKTHLGQLAKSKTGHACDGSTECTVEDMACCA
jgi:glutathione S-transferase